MIKLATRSNFMTFNTLTSLGPPFCRTIRRHFIWAQHSLGLQWSSGCAFCGAMGRVNNRTKASASETAGKSENRRLSNADRSAYFARREAAKILRRVLEGDAQRRAVASIKSLVYAPSVRNKKGTFALVCKTLKCKFWTKALSRNECWMILKSTLV